MTAGLELLLTYLGLKQTATRAGAAAAHNSTCTNNAQKLHNMNNVHNLEHAHPILIAVLSSGLPFEKLDRDKVLLLFPLLLLLLL